MSQIILKKETVDSILEFLQKYDDGDEIDDYAAMHLIKRIKAEKAESPKLLPDESFKAI